MPRKVCGGKKREEEERRENTYIKGGSKKG